MHCSNCGAQLSCGCQVRTASNGVKVCSTCVGTYETNLAKMQQSVSDAKKENDNDSNLNITSAI